MSVKWEGKLLLSYYIGKLRVRKITLQYLQNQVMVVIVVEIQGTKILCCDPKSPEESNIFH